MSDKDASKILVVAMIAVVLIVFSITLKPVNNNEEPKIVRSYKVGDEPSIHRVWRVVIDGRRIEYVEMVNDWRKSSNWDE